VTGVMDGGVVFKLGPNIYSIAMSPYTPAGAVPSGNFRRVLHAGIAGCSGCSGPASSPPSPPGPNTAAGAIAGAVGARGI